MPNRTPAVLPSLAAIVLLAACSGAASIAPPSGVAPSTQGTVTPTATPIPTDTMAPATMAPTAAGVVAILDGTYATAPIPVSDIDARIQADTALTAAQRTGALQTFAGHTTETFKLTLSGSSWTELEAWDGGAFEVGARAVFAATDAHTVVIQETCCGVMSFVVTSSGSGFALKVKKSSATNAEDDLLDHIVYESGPFLPVP